MNTALYVASAAITLLHAFVASESMQQQVYHMILPSGRCSLQTTALLRGDTSVSGTIYGAFSGHYRQGDADDCHLFIEVERKDYVISVTVERTDFCANKHHIRLYDSSFIDPTNGLGRINRFTPLDSSYTTSGPYLTILFVRSDECSNNTAAEDRDYLGFELSYKTAHPTKITPLSTPLPPSSGPLTTSLLVTLILSVVIVIILSLFTIACCYLNNKRRPTSRGAPRRGKRASVISAPVITYHPGTGDTLRPSCDSLEDDGDTVGGTVNSAYEGSSSATGSLVVMPTLQQRTAFRVRAVTSVDNPYTPTTCRLSQDPTTLAADILEVDDRSMEPTDNSPQLNCDN